MYGESIIGSNVVSYLTLTICVKSVSFDDGTLDESVMRVRVGLRIVGNRFLRD